MTSRERLLCALKHEEPDRIPLDMGSIVSGITLSAYRNLVQHLGFAPRERLVDRSQYLVHPGEELLNFLHVDTRYVYEEIPEEIWRKDAPGTVWIDEWGVERRFTGLYHDMVRHPLAGLERGEELKKISHPSLPGEDYYQRVREELLRIRKNGQAGIVNCIGSCFESSWYLVGFEKFMTKLSLEPALACAVMDWLLDFELRQFETLLDRVGDLVDVVLCGDDLATQKGPLLSLAMYRRYIKPRQERLYRLIKKKTTAFLFYHSCGAVAPFLEDLIEIGVDIINPVQVSAAGMDTRELKKRFGEALTFWGGIDTQRVLPFGTTEEVRKEVRQRIDDLAAGGGFVLCAVHNLQADVPPQNIVAMYEEALRYGEY